MQVDDLLPAASPDSTAYGLRHLPRKRDKRDWRQGNHTVEQGGEPVPLQRKRAGEDRPANHCVTVCLRIGVSFLSAANAMIAVAVLIAILLLDSVSVRGRA